MFLYLIGFSDKQDMSVSILHERWVLGNAHHNGFIVINHNGLTIQGSVSVAEACLGNDNNKFAGSISAFCMFSLSV